MYEAKKNESKALVDQVTALQSKVTQVRPGGILYMHRRIP